jgi:hypothetical protein
MIGAPLALWRHGLGDEGHIVPKALLFGRNAHDVMQAREADYRTS